MPGTYTQILFHIVFSTKQRRRWIQPEWSGRLHSYLGGIVRAERGTAIEIGGVEDHVHLLVLWRADEPLSNLMRTLKSRSSKWVHETIEPCDGFAWQEGYAAFSVSKSNEEAVKRYIANQAEHHARFDFKAELLKLLRAHAIEFDAQYVFD